MDILFYGVCILATLACAGGVAYGIQQISDRAVVAQGTANGTVGIGLDDNDVASPDDNVSEPEAAEETDNDPPEPEPAQQEQSELAHEGLYIGDTCPTQPRLFWLYPHPKVFLRDFPQEDRFKHTYILGLTGAGKTSVLQHLIPQDILDEKVSKGIIVMGPDHELFEYLGSYISPERREDVLYFNPNNVFQDKVIGWNPLEFSEAKNLPDFVWRPLYQQKVTSVYNVLSRTLEGGVTEPQRELLLEVIYGLVALEQVALKDVDILLDPTNPTLRQAIANTRRVEERTRRYWQAYDNDSSRQASATALRKKFITLFHEPLATLFASHAFTWRDILAHPRIVFVDLSDIVDPAKGIVAELVLAEIEMDVIRREHSKRKKIPYYVYIDEFTDFMHAGDSTNALFAKARKNWLGFTLAHQTRENFKGDLEGVIMRNTKTRIIMKANAQDARWYTQELQRFDPDATQAEPRAKAHQVSQGSIISAILQNLQVGQAIVRLEVEGVPHCVPVSIPRFK